jgi:hypothetical protein
MMPDVMKLEIEEGRGDQYQMDSGADPEDNDKDTALLLSVREIVDHSRSRRDTAGVDH